MLTSVHLVRYINSVKTRRQRNMARRKSIKVEIANNLDELTATLKELEIDYPVNAYDIEIKRMSITGVNEWWYIEVWKL